MAPKTHVSETIAPVLVRMGEIRRRARRLFAVYGMGMVVAVACFVGAVSFALDWAMRDLPYPVRLIILALCLCAVGYTAFRHLIYPLRRPITDDDVAICIERAFPDLKDRLISSVQLSRDQGSGINLNSPVLVEKLVRETMEYVSGLKFTTVLVPAVPVRVFAGGIALLLLALTYTVLYPKNTFTWLKRFYDPDARWEKKTTLVVDLPDELLIGKGDTFRATVKVQGTVPSRVNMAVTYDSGVSVKERLDKGQQEREFLAAISRVQESFVVRFEGGDDRTKDFRVKVLTPPRVERVRVVYSYPKYMGLADTNPDVPVEGGNIKAPVGTTVKVIGTSNIPLQSGRVFLGRREQEQLVPTTLGADAEKGQHHQLTATFEVVSDSEYYFQLVGDNQLACDDAVRYTVRVLMDNAPVLKILEPNADKLVTPEASLRVRAQTVDDFGVSLVSLSYALASGDGKIEKRVDFDTSHNDVKYGEKTINSEYTFELPGIGAKPGDTVTYFLEARDNRDKPEPNTTKSRVFALTVVSRDQLQRLTEERQQRIREELRRLIEAEMGERKNTDRYEKLLAPKEDLEHSERQMLHGSAAAQRQIGQRLERLAKEVGDVVGDIATNKLWDVSVQERLSNMQARMNAVATTQSPEAANMLAQAANSPKQEERAESIAIAGAKQGGIVNELKELYGQMEEWEDYADIARRVRELLDKHRQVMKTVEGGEGPEKK